MSALGAAAFSAAWPVFAQQPPRVRRIGFLAMRSRSTLDNPDNLYGAFVAGMRKLGYVEGQNLVIEWRFADGKSERLPELAAELVKLNVEVQVGHSTPGILALKRATSNIPIVMSAINNPVESGFVNSLARPGGNITGTSLIASDLSPKRLQLLKTMSPKLTRGALLTNPGNPTHPLVVKSITAAGKTLGIQTIEFNAATADEIDKAFAMMKKERAQALILVPDAFFTFHRQQLGSLCIKYRLPSMFPYREHVDAGGLMSYGQNLVNYYAYAATFVGKILGGTKPANIPVEQPVKIELVINSRTAKALGLTIPKELVLRADEVIE